MTSRKLLLTLVVLLLAVVVVARTSADRIKQPLPSTVQNLADAKVIEIKDSAGQVLLRGTFVKTTESKDESEFTAPLDGAGTDAAGKAEIEIETKNAVTKQELEVSATKLPSAASLKLFLDGSELMTFTTNKAGKADIKLSSDYRPKS